MKNINVDIEKHASEIGYTIARHLLDGLEKPSELLKHLLKVYNEPMFNVNPIDTGTALTINGAFLDKHDELTFIYCKDGSIGPTHICDKATKDSYSRKMLDDYCYPVVMLHNMVLQNILKILILKSDSIVLSQLFNDYDI